MSSGLVDDEVNTVGQRRYGLASFAAVAINTLVLEFVTWVLMVTAWYLLPVIVLPALAVDALVAYGLTRARGVASQVGRGMAIGCIAPLLTVLIFIPGWIIAQNFAY
jgi:hypothetical protein